MKTQMARHHNFENRLNYVRKARKYYYLGHENGAQYLIIKRNATLDVAFNNYCWDAFETAEADAHFYGQEKYTKI